MSPIYWTSRTQSTLWIVALHRNDPLNANVLAVHHDAIHHKPEQLLPFLEAQVLKPLGHPLAEDLKPHKGILSSDLLLV